MTTKKQSIPDDVRAEVERVVADFNHKTFGNAGVAYSAHFRGKYLYLKRSVLHGKPHPICRLTYTGKMDGWKFTIYRHTKNRYDENAIFPGAGELDGTVEGAMRAGLKAYPA